MFLMATTPGSLNERNAHPLALPSFLHYACGSEVAANAERSSHFTAFCRTACQDSSCYPSKDETAYQSSVLLMVRHRHMSVSKTLTLALIALGVVGAFRHAIVNSTEAAVLVPPPRIEEPANSAPYETAVLAGGCFWGVQGVFEHVKGVVKAVSGYTGGDALTARYQEVGLGSTGHAESVQITFDTSKISYGQILQIYFSVAHDPTQLDRQGPDHGTQYRSTIFPMSSAQQTAAAAYIAQIDNGHVFSKPIATTIETGKTFFPAEAYHQDFLEHNEGYGYIIDNDLPKIANLERMFPESFRQQPVLVNPWPK